MAWTETETDGYELFWHVTTRHFIESIENNGIEQSTGGSDGDGVYCIRRNVDEQTELHSLLQFMEQNDIPKEELIIVEFEYMGTIFINDIKSFYLESGWIRIPTEIEPERVEKIMELNEI